MLLFFAKMIKAERNRKNNNSGLPYCREYHSFEKLLLFIVCFNSSVDMFMFMSTEYATSVLPSILPKSCFMNKCPWLK